MKLEITIDDELFQEMEEVAWDEKFNDVYHYIDEALRDFTYELKTQYEEDE